MDIPAFPTHVQIQTSPACGADCTICPHPEKSPQWSNGPMSDALFERVVDQLRGQPVEYLCPYLMADGLSDRKIFDRIAALRDALPDTHFEVSTTGMYLAPKIADRLLQAPLNELRISSHGINAADYARTMPGVHFDRAMANIRRFIERWRVHQPYELSIVSLWGLWSRQREAEIEAFWARLGVPLSRWRVISRGKQVDLTIFGDGSPDPTGYSGATWDPPYTCRFQRDTHWLHILSDGRVALCCMDYSQQEILGDVSTQTIDEIWTGSAYARVRAQVRGDLPADANFLCSRCEWRVSENHATESTRDEHLVPEPAACP